MAEIGPGLQKMIDQAHLPPWLATRFHDEGAGLQQASFAATMYVKGYGRDARFGLPTNEQALPTLLNPSAAFWSSTPQHKADRDWGVEHAPKLSSVTHWTLGPLEAIAKIPVLGPVIKAAAAPITTVAHLAEGQPLGQAALDNFKSQIGAIKAVGPYAATVISFIPGIGTGVAAALAAGTALAEGKPIDQALEEGIRGAIPGGAIAQAGFDMARKIASGENVGKAALETARAQLPAEAQKAFDVGVAVVSGKQLQQALAAGITSLAPDAVKQIFDIGAHVVQTTPGLSGIAKALPNDIARQGLQLASGALAHAGINESQIRAMRAKLSGDMLKGFDSALQAQAQHFPWLDGIAETPAAAPDTEQQRLEALAQLTPEQQKQLTDLASLSTLTPDQQKQLAAYAQTSKAPASAPKPSEPSKPAPPKPPEPPKAPVAVPKPPEPTRAPPAAARAPGEPAYPPYPKMGGAVHGLGGPPPHCAVWGAPVAMNPTMQWAARSALIASKGRPAVARAPGGVLYMFTVENGVMMARPCASGA